MKDHENRDAEPPRECPNSLKALVYFNFVLLFFVGIMFFGDLKNVDDLDEVGFLGLLYAFLFLFILAFAIRDGKPGGRLRSVAHLPTFSRRVRQETEYRLDSWFERVSLLSRRSWRQSNGEMSRSRTSCYLVFRASRVRR